MTVVDDSLLELNESFRVRAFLEVPISGIRIIPDEVHITIQDDDCKSTLIPHVTDA